VATQSRYAKSVLIQQVLPRRVGLCAHPAKLPRAPTQHVAVKLRAAAHVAIAQGALALRAGLARQRCRARLTHRSSGPAAAGGVSLSRSGFATVARQAYAACRSVPLSSNVRWHAKGMEGMVCKSAVARQVRASAKSAKSGQLSVRGATLSHGFCSRALLPSLQFAGIGSSAGPKPRRFVVPWRASASPLSGMRSESSASISARAQSLAGFFPPPRCAPCCGRPWLRSAGSAAAAFAVSTVPPNPSLKRSATGRAPGPRGCHAYHQPRGPGTLPLSPA